MAYKVKVKFGKNRVRYADKKGNFVKEKKAYKFKSKKKAQKLANIYREEILDLENQRPKFKKLHDKVSVEKA
jgi:thymidylate kinase